MAEMLTALRVAREIGSSPAFDDWRANETLPGPDVQDPAELCEYLRRDTDPYNHPVGARLRIIGLASDPLDRNGRWRGTRRWRGNRTRRRSRSRRCLWRPSS